MNKTGKIYAYIREFPKPYFNPDFEKCEFSLKELDWHERDKEARGGVSNPQRFKPGAAMADKPSLKEKLDAFEAQAVGSGNPEIGVKGKEEML